jgi:hypothetical protein
MLEKKLVVTEGKTSSLVYRVMGNEKGTGKRIIR